MPSIEHEILVELFRRAPEVVTRILGALAVPLPQGAAATVVDRAFSEVSLSEIHADLVVLLRAEDRPALVVILEVQRVVDPEKDYTWPLYAVAARREHRCDAVVLVVSEEPAVLRRAKQAIALGPGSVFRVFGVGPAEVPVPLPEEAQRWPELAVLAALTHARSADAVDIAFTALVASTTLDDEHAGLYWNRILDALSEPDRITLEIRMNTSKIEYMSEFARGYFKAGEREGEARGEARGKGVAILAVLEARGLAVADEDRARFLECTDGEQLLAWLRRAATARTAAEVLREIGR